MPEPEIETETRRPGRRRALTTPRAAQIDEQDQAGRAPVVFEDPDPPEEKPQCWFFTFKDKETGAARAMECNVVGQFVENPEDPDDPGFDGGICLICIQAKDVIQKTGRDPFYEGQRAPE